MEKYQVLIIGGGPGGNAAAFRLSQYGISNATIEKEELGGVCLNWGCIPTKTLVKTAELVSEIRHSENYGLPPMDLKLDYSKILQRKNTVVEQLSKGLEHSFRKSKLAVIKETAVSIAKEDEGYIVQSREGQSYFAPYIIIATGSTPKNLPGITIDEKDIMSSRGILDMETLPKSLAIVGGGVIGCEFASIFASFGVEVTIVEFLPRLISLEDEEISKRLTLLLKRSGIKVLTKTGVESIEKAEGESILKLNNDSEIRAEKVLLAVGRTPAFGLETQGFELAGERGAITIDDSMKSSAAGIYAIGDVTAKLQLAHTASTQGILASEQIAAEILGKPKPTFILDYANIPRCTFTNPEVGSVGLTEAEAKDTFGEIKISKFPFSANGKATAMAATQGIVKCIARKDTGTLVGMHIIGPQAAELIAQGAIMISNNMTAASVEEIVFAHPTLSEAIMESVGELRDITVPNK
ncbi:MAG: dihydrolipoyl dehydrogenase [Candidatus Cloacimonadaceae bacterium]|jgi:dihydrolipoamide dehydrogenase|nr:dihydrolipoyl dehydrogenase [Candidatus Cloacimonadota bacterium]MCK9178631.1 dihydrolipoyl dehydrogenase [Candidatus Cloacimonadota bacterium]MDD3103971.1 dihydrolipoyl dehydrogenase [Candidatus Cloacimonadota bacterium]MDD3534116.1 dihydrolipoyl dehydrogenase [Candidatus Cloacimonadota bacterium]MDY0128199.1 dihydrolipoyl dehydrogenase [Candidatus Cloacimonadaceae bacterium]